MTQRTIKDAVRTSLVIPCYNEAEGVPQLCQKLAPLVETLREDGGVEVLFVDDGSTDGSADVIRRLAGAFPYRIVTHPTNRGLGAALRTGFRESVGDEIVTLDSDCTYDPLQVLDLLKILHSGCDVVTGSPYHPDGEVVGVSGWRLFLSKTLSRLYWIILPGRLYTYTSCFRAYRREIMPVLRSRSNGFLAVTELLASALLKKARVGELPTRLHTRMYGQSKIKIINVMLSHVGYMTRVVWWRIVGNEQPFRHL